MRRVPCLALLALASVLAPAANAQPPEPAKPLIALTFDDLPAHGSLPAGESRLDVINAIIAALKEADVPATGFVNGSFGADDPDSLKVLAAWTAAGLPLANHTFAHPHLDQIGAKAFLADLDRNERFVKGQAKWLRYPFLEEGHDPVTRDAVRAGLAKRGYRIAAVTLSFDDYAYNDPFVRCVSQRSDIDVAALEARYLASARVDANRAHSISMAMLDRDVPQVLLLHVGAFTARMLPDLIAQYRAMGFAFTTLEKAQADPFYAAANDPRLPGPSPSLEALVQKMRQPLFPKLPLPGDDICPAK